MASANVLRTIFTYNLTGLGPYTIAFDYLARKFVQVTLIGPDRKLLVLNTDYRFSATKAITLLKAAPAGYTQIEIRRYTDASDRLVDFQDGSILRATDLNVSQVQTMHIAEEGRDVASNTLGVDSDGNLDARGRKLVNLVDGQNDQDAVTIRQMKAWNESALNSATASAQSAAAALVSEQHSKTSETNSKTSETNSGNSASLAQKWAANPTGTLVDATRYSSLHYSVQSELSSQAAQGAATTATQQAQAASGSASSALGSANAASGSASSAKSDADRAQTANPDNQLKKANNLDDVADKGIARFNLGLSYGGTAGTVVQGNDSRVVNALQKSGGVMTGAINSDVQGAGLMKRSAGAVSSGGTIINYLAQSTINANQYMTIDVTGTTNNILSRIVVWNTNPKVFGFYDNGNGQCDGTWQNGSDERHKDNIKPVANPLASVLSSRGVTYDKKDGLSEVGLIAQDIERFCPLGIQNTGHREFTDGTVIEDFKSLNTGGVGAAYSFEAIKALTDIIELSLTDPEGARKAITDARELATKIKSN